jgi:Flp pilus assembly protein TadG
MSVFRRFRGERGSLLVEASLSAMLLMTLLAGIVEAGQLLYDTAWISNMARQSSRYAMVRGSASTRAITAAQMTTYAQGIAGGLNTSNMTVTTTWSPNNAPGSTVKVKIQYTFHGYLPFLPINTVTLQSSSQMVISQ